MSKGSYWQQTDLLLLLLLLSDWNSWSAVVWFLFQKGSALFWKKSSFSQGHVRQFCRLNQKKVSPLISSFARFFKMCIEISRLQHSWWQSGLLRSSATQENFLSFCLNTCRTSSRANYHISMPTHGAMMVNLLNTSTLMLASESC